MIPGTKVQGTLSVCCGSSVSTYTGYFDKITGKFIPYHHQCNSCRKDCQIIKKDMWVITNEGKYKAINR